MAYTVAQQARLTEAQNKLDKAKANYNGYVASYDNYGADITPCYDGSWYDASQAATWFNPLETHCTKKGECTGSDKNQCQAFVRTLNTSIIPGLRSALTELKNSQSNYDKVLAEVISESASDPSNILQQQQQQQNADIAEQQLLLNAALEKEKNRQTIKKLIFALLAIVVIGVVIIVGIKMIGKSSS